MEDEGFFAHLFVCFNQKFRAGLCWKTIYHSKDQDIPNTKQVKPDNRREVSFHGLLRLHYYFANVYLTTGRKSPFPKDLTSALFN